MIRGMRKIRSPMNSSTPASAACGTCARSRAPKAMSPRTRAAATRPAIWERPPVSVDDRGAGRAGVDREGAAEAGEDAAGADPDEIAVDAGCLAGLGGEGARRRGGLQHDDERHDERQRHDMEELVERHPGQREARQTGGNRAENADAVALEPEQQDGGGGDDQGRSMRRECGR